LYKARGCLAKQAQIRHSPGDDDILVLSHRLMDVRQAVLEQAGLDKQIISLTTPGTLMETPWRSAELSWKVNDSFAAIQEEHGDHFVALGTLPLNDPAASAAELERARGELGLKGISLMLIGSLEKMVSSIQQLDISQQDRADILGGNATRLLKR
jgi:predicted TIM-barrel fold metal-dependent hydrolase